MGEKAMKVVRAMKAMKAVKAVKVMKVMRAMKARKNASKVARGRMAKAMVLQGKKAKTAGGLEAKDLIFACLQSCNNFVLEALWLQAFLFCRLLYPSCPSPSTSVDVSTLDALWLRDSMLSGFCIPPAFSLQCTSGDINSRALLGI